MKYVLIVTRLWKPVFFCVVFGFLCELIYLKTNSCEEGDSIAQIQSLCSMYHNNEVVGNMCSDLCDQSTLSFSSCHGNRSGKKVIIMSCDGCIEPGKTSTVVLKIRYDMMTWWNSMSKFTLTLNTTEEKIYRSSEEIQFNIMKYYGTEVQQHKDLISLMFGENYKNLVRKLDTPNAIDAVLRTTIGLGTQEEFLSHRVLGSPSFLPKLYGVCGPGYFVENTPSLTTLKYIFLLLKQVDALKMSLAPSPPWKDRAGVALGLLKMIPQAEDNYNTPLQICDYAPHNFGLSESGEVVMLDSDSLTFGQVVTQGSCDVDDDCEFFYCRWHCNQTTKLCTKEMTVNNLQLLCRRILSPKIEMLGLLRFPPSSIQEPLRNLLYQCSNTVPSVLKVTRENKSDRKLLREIEMLLKSTL